MKLDTKWRDWLRHAKPVAKSNYKKKQCWELRFVICVRDLTCRFEKPDLNQGNIYFLETTVQTTELSEAKTKLLIPTKVFWFATFCGY